MLCQDEGKIYTQYSCMNLDRLEGLNIPWHLHLIRSCRREFTHFIFTIFLRFILIITHARHFCVLYNKRNSFLLLLNPLL